jgi:uncharacterized protein YdiU (UPF0061 family)
VTRPALRAHYAASFPELVHPWQPLLPPAGDGPAPTMIAVNDDLAAELGLDPEWLRGPQALDVLGARAVLAGSTPVAQAYAGHQFGGFSPLLGDGRAVLLGELTDPVSGALRDLALKGSGRTVFARGGDGRAVIGPVLREYLMGEAMHAQGIPTTRALAAVTTGDRVWRDGAMPPGAVLSRVAASHLRVGTLELAAHSLRTHDRLGLLQRLVDHAAIRHHGVALDEAGHADPLLFLEAVVDAQARLVAQWMSAGFVHGVLNTDNTALSGQTIDYGPCAWIETYDAAAVFSSIDHQGRYRFGNQPAILQWNLTRLAECLLPLISEALDAAVDAATDVLQTFPARYEVHRLARYGAKLALPGGPAPGDRELVDDLVALLASDTGAGRPDYVSSWRALSAALRRTDEDATDHPLVAAARANGWWQRWMARLGAASGASEVYALDATGGLSVAGRHTAAAAMDATNPAYVPRNHLVEEALDSAAEGELGPFEALLHAVSHPFVERPQWQRYAEPAPRGFTERHVTYCGT